MTTRYVVETEPVWVRPDAALHFHDEQIATHGGAAGVRDHGLFEAAMMRPQMKFQYGERDLASFAAAYAFGLARNHPFVDGNKRTALVVMETFLSLNGFQMRSDNIAAAALILELAAGELSEEQLAEWIRGDLEDFEPFQ
jgi:death-on-curing protein